MYIVKDLENNCIKWATKSMKEALKRIGKAKFVTDVLGHEPKLSVKWVGELAQIDN